MTINKKAKRKNQSKQLMDFTRPMMENMNFKSKNTIKRI